MIPDITATRLQGTISQLELTIANRDTEIKRLQDKLGNICAFPLCDCEGSECMVLDGEPPETCARSDLVEEHDKRLAADKRIIELGTMIHTCQTKKVRALDYLRRILKCLGWIEEGECHSEAEIIKTSKEFLDDT